MTASIVIPTAGRSGSLAVTLAALQRDPTLDAAAEIVVIESGPPCGAAAVVAGASSRLPLRCVPEPAPGLHEARHRGAREAKGDLLVYIDDDVSVSAGWAAALVAPFADPAVACVGGPVTAVLAGEPPPWLGQFDPWYLSALDLGNERRELCWPEGVNGCNLAVRRQALLAVGGFNPDAFADPAMDWLRGDGEGGLQRKLRDAGLRVVYEPAARVDHLIPRSRLTQEAFVRRARLEGIGASFTALRERSFSGRYRAALVLGAARALARAARRRAAGLVLPGRAVRARADAAFHLAYAGHHLRALTSARLRAHVGRDSFLM
jgi:GT2 family glycosyltransferase